MMIESVKDVKVGERLLCTRDLHMDDGRIAFVHGLTREK